MRYFITFTCYGARLHGDESGSVDRDHNLVGSRLLEPNVQRVMAERRKMLQDPYVLDDAGRAVVLAAIQKHCGYRGWKLLAAHVRSNHVHTIVEAETSPERIMNEFKAYASRELNRLAGEGRERKRWARHGSTVGCGRTRMSGRRFNTWSKSKVSRWPCSSPRSFSDRSLAVAARKRSLAVAARNQLSCRV